MHCNHCGREIPQESRYCCYCGQTLSKNQSEPNNRKNAFVSSFSTFFKQNKKRVVAAAAAVIAAGGIGTYGINRLIASNTASCETGQGVLNLEKMKEAAAGSDESLKQLLSKYSKDNTDKEYSEVDTQKSEYKIQTTVYITPSGTKYHRASCRYVKKNGIAKNLDDVKGSYEPCSVCKP